MSEKSLKERQVEVAQQWVDEIGNIRPKLKGQKVVAVDSTENHAEAIVRFNDWTTARVVGLEAKIILSGRTPFDEQSNTKES